MKKKHAAPLTLSILLATAAAPQPAQPPAAAAGPTFSAEQAGRGKTQYATECASCHGPNLSGGDTASALNGNTFSQNWGGKSAESLFTFIRTRMPPGKPGSLGAAATADLVAYLLQVNGGGQQGEQTLPADAARLAQVTIRRGPLAPTAPFMPLSPLAPPLPRVAVANPLDKLTAVTDTLLQSPPDGEWLTWRRTYDDQGFSPLKQIDRRNVGRLRVAWVWSLPNGPNETTPLEHDGVLFVAAYGDRVQALNAATGDLLWQYSRQLPSDARASVKRNLAIYRDRLLVPTSDCHVVALDVRTGVPVWDSPVADIHAGWQCTGGPLIAEGKVLQGVAGPYVRGGGAIVALDFESGKEAWRFRTIPRPGEPGGDSWNGQAPEERSGASVWTAGSYDPRLHLAFFGTGNTYDTGPLLHPIRKPGITNDGLYTDTTLALNPSTGRLVWHFQHVHNDQWDLDWAFEHQVIDLPFGGAMRHLVVTAGKMGLYEAMDAASGKFVFSKDLGIQNIVTSVDPVSGEKALNPAVILGDGKPHTICPHPGGGRNWIAGSYNPDTRALYVPMVESCMDLIPAPPGQRGNLSSGYNWSIRQREDSDGKFGRLEAFNVATRQVLWVHRQRAPVVTGVLDTAGGVVFSGSLDRYFEAYDDATGAQLWRVRTNDVPSSCPISYSVGGKQYVAIVVSAGGSQSATFTVLVPEIQNPPEHGAAVWVFELGG